MTAKQKIIKYLKRFKKHEWIHSGRLEKKAFEWGYKPSNISRRLRELREDGQLERKENDKGHVMYRIKSEQSALV